MNSRSLSFTTLISALLLGLSLAATTVNAARDVSSLTLTSGRVSISGTSNIHPYTAASADVRLMRAKVANGVVVEGWTDILKPGAIEAFEIAIPAATLSSPKEGIDKTMHKALKVTEHPDITFRLARLEAMTAPGAYQAIGTLEIAGVAREVTLDVKTQPRESALVITGEIRVLMTDYGIKPPIAMLGMLKTDPKVTVTFEAVLAMPSATATN